MKLSFLIFLEAGQSNGSNVQFFTFPVGDWSKHMSKMLY